MGISRDSRHKRRLTGGRMPVHQKKRAFEKARPISNTKLVNDKARIRSVRTRGGNLKFRALRLKEGNFNWASESITRKTRIIDVVYNASNNELVRTKTLVKNCIVTIDATPFAQWYLNHYGVQIVAKKAKEAKKEEVKRSERSQARINERQKDRVIDPKVNEQFNQQRLYACISSRPGQSGRCDGYILEGRELEFYAKRIEAKKK
jgi:small subunit ribosomal protein S8e